MSAERFDRIEHELTDFRSRFDRIDVRFDAVDARFAEVDARFDAVDRRFEGVDARFNSVDERLDELRRHMLVLHEDMLDRFAAQNKYSGPTREEFAEVKDMLARRLDPLEMVVRQHSVDIAKLKRARR